MATHDVNRAWRGGRRGREEPLWPWLLLAFLVLLVLGLTVPLLAGWVTVDLSG